MSEKWAVFDREYDLKNVETRHIAWLNQRWGHVIPLCAVSERLPVGWRAARGEAVEALPLCGHCRIKARRIARQAGVSDD